MKNILKKIFSVYGKHQHFFERIIPNVLLQKLKDLLNAYTLRKLAAVPVSEKESRAFGVNLVGYMTAPTGLGQGVRSLGQALDFEDIPWCAIDFNQPGKKNNNVETLWQHKIVEEPQFDINLIHLNPNTLYRGQYYLPQSLWKSRYNIGYFAWELPEVPKNWIPAFALFDEIWGPSGFVKESIEKQTEKPVFAIPYGIDISGEAFVDRSHFGLPADIFLFLTMYDIHSTAGRKNPMGAVKAFLKAFSKEEKNVGFVIKINKNANHKTHEIEKMKEMLSGYLHVYFIEDILSRQEVNSLIHCCDVFLSLHRAEGLGLVMAEAMSLKKPVVATNWSGNTEFMNGGNACAVNYKLKKLKKTYGHYKKGNIWAEPDLDHAAFYMQKLVSDPQFYNEIGQKGQQQILSEFNHAKCGEKIKGRLNIIRSTLYN